MTYAAHCYACEHANIRPVGSCSDRQFFCRIAAISSHSIVPAMTKAPRPIRRVLQYPGETVNRRGEMREDAREADGKILGT